VGNVTGRFVDAVGRLVTLTNPLGHRMRYDYDALNRRTRVTDALGLSLSIILSNLEGVR
jgi:YD repeat-containing protein